MTSPHRHEAAGADDHRYVLPLLAGDRAQVQLPQRRFVEVLERVGREFGFPTAIGVDQGTEFVSRDLDLWAYRRDVILDFSRPGKPTDNAFIESFMASSGQSAEAHWFMSLDDAHRKCEAWRRDYSEERPHSAIGNRAPIELVDRSAALGPPWSRHPGKA
jgi:putative transposase